MILRPVNTTKLGMSTFPGLTRLTPPSAGAGLQGMGDVTIAGQTFTTTQLLVGVALLYLLLRR